MLIYQCLFDFCCSLYVFYKFQSKLVRVDLPLIGNQEKGCGLWEVVFQNLGDGEGKDNHEVTYDSGYSKSDECQHANDLQVIRQQDISHTVQPYTLSCFCIEKKPTFRINMNHPSPPLFTSLRPLPLLPLVSAFIAACFPSDLELELDLDVRYSGLSVRE